MTEMRKSAVNGIECRVESLDSVELSIKIAVNVGYSIPYARQREKRVSVSRQQRAGRRGGGGKEEGGEGEFLDYANIYEHNGTPMSAAPIIPSSMESRAPPPAK